MSRPVGRRCPNRHRHAWVLTSAPSAASWLWCEDCGAVAPNERMARRRWAYPGDRETALVASKGWSDEVAGESAQVSAAQDD